ncbi:N-acetylmannosamine-6-phosphate 2-epimerase [Streptomyces boninensis]|uniref:N-acetylmannosamine-6-phosphate 2-epimerase n=1 Tax=Streptomyces boninensis TaxID=2039455 RepID=UPI003B219831
MTAPPPPDPLPSPEATATPADLAATLAGKLIVSCQAPDGDPMCHPDTLVRMTQAAQAGGAAAVRVNSPEVVAATVKAIDIPVIALWKDGPETAVRITPTVRHALALVDAGATVIAADATTRPRPDGSTFADLVTAVHAAGAQVMADVSNLTEGREAAALAVDFVSTTLSGYVPGSPQSPEPDLRLVADLAATIRTPVVAEGRIATPAQAAQALAAGAHSVVVGTAITAPTALTRLFVGGLDS